MLPDLLQAGLDDVLGWVGQAWVPWIAPHQFLFGMSGAGKTTLERALLAACCKAERVVVLDPKHADDESWTAGPWAPAPVTSLPARFGENRDGGGPKGMWYRLTASDDPAETARRFHAAIRLMQREGHAIAVLDDAHAICSLPGLRRDVDDLLGLGRSAWLSCIVASGDLGYVPRAHFAFKWIGHFTTTEAAKAAAGLLGQRGRAWEEQILATRSYQWIYDDDRPGNPGPCRLDGPAL